MNSVSNITLNKPAGIARWMKLYRLYRSAFPASEQKPFRMILKMFRRGKTDIWCVERDGAFAGLAITINGPDMVLLDYFAVAEECRGQGIGSAALGEILRCYRDRGVFLEIESTHEDAPNRAQREKRKRFYLANGLEELHTEARLFGVMMELLGRGCSLDFEGYQSFYRDNYSPWAAEHIER